MSLTAGTRLGPYEVVAPLGAGGMGEVYRARDTRLGRDVAIKILPALVAADPERKARFEREARTLASLNHPNIAGIHGVEDGQGLPALVLELVEGPTLADRIAQGPMPVDDALAAARQIADALEAAHVVGIIHRDLKPANIKLRPDGAVKVLDFGLAKAIVAARDGSADTSGRLGADLSHSPTITGPIGMTGVGVLLGTAAYMPPEQARGKPVDRRADIWAFGCVLYEMLAGKRCFDGEDTSLTLAEVIKSEPDWSALPATTPAAVRSTLKYCLQKDPRRRFHDIADVRLALEGAFAPAAASATPLPTTRGWALPTVAAAAGLIAGATAAIAVMWRPPPAPGAAPAVTRFTVTMPSGTNFRQNVAVPIALAADGRRLLLNVSTAGGDRVLVRSMDQMQPQPVQGLEGTVGSVFLSPDGEWIGFNDSRGFLKRMRLSGGPAATVTEIGTGPGGGGFGGATWGTGQTIVFATAANRALMTVPEGGGSAKPLTTPDESEAHNQPHFLPDGRSLLLTVRKPGGFSEIAYLAAGAATPVALLQGTDPRYLSTGHLLFVREAAVWAVGFDPASGRTVGDPSPVLEGVNITGGGIGRFTVSANGTLAFLAGNGTGGLRTIVRGDRDGTEEALAGLAPGNFGTIRISPDGTRLAYDVGRPSDVWVYEFARGTTTRITTTDAVDSSPVWTVDGSRLVYSSSRDGRSELYVRNADGTGAAERVMSGDSPAPRLDADAWTPGGEQLLVTLGRGGNADIGTIGFNADRQFREVLTSPSSVEASPAISPDGRWLAYHSNLSGTFEVYVERFPELGQRQRISTSGGSAARWSPSSRELFFQSADGRRIFTVPVTLGAKLGVGTAKMLFEGPYVPSGPGVRGFEVMPDGRFLLLKAAAPVPESNSPATVTIVQNWTEELKRLVPGAGRPQ
jgi:serine/threonine-protein kinase